MRPSRERIELAALAGAGLAGGVWKYIVRPELTAKRGWLAIGAGVLAYELACPAGETLSEGVDRALEARKALTLGAIGVTALHLANLIPPQYDPFRRAIDLLKA